MNEENLKTIDLNELKAKVFDEVYKKIINDEKDEYSDLIVEDIFIAYEIFEMIEKINVRGIV